MWHHQSSSYWLYNSCSLCSYFIPIKINNLGCWTVSGSCSKCRKNCKAKHPNHISRWERWGAWKDVVCKNPPSLFIGCWNSEVEAESWDFGCSNTKIVVGGWGFFLFFYETRTNLGFELLEPNVLPKGGARAKASSHPSPSSSSESKGASMDWNSSKPLWLFLEDL